MPPALTLLLALLLAGLATGADVHAQEPPEAPGPEANEDPDQGQPQAQPDALEPPGTLFPGIHPPWRTAIANLRQRVYDNYGLTFGLGYAQLFQWASATAPFALGDTAFGGWFALSMTWTPIDRDGDYEGALVVRPAFRGPLGDNSPPSLLGLRDIGSLWSNYEFTNWEGGMKVEDLFWEQWLGPGFSFRVGNMGPQAVFNFSRFKDARTSFTASTFAFHDTIPYPTFGFGGSFRWMPLAPDPDFYIVGTLNDMNGDPAALGLDWSTLKEGQFFYGVEIGKRWRRPNEFDHFNLDVFYADDRVTRSPETSPNEAGWGLRVYGEKQVGRYVALGGYTYNTAEGGGISTTFTRNTGTVGLAYLRPFGVYGEAAFGFMWSQLIPDLIPGLGARNQYGLESYWHIGVTPNSSVTPGIQLIFNPALNPNDDVVAVPHIKFRLAF